MPLLVGRNELLPAGSLPRVDVCVSKSVQHVREGVCYCDRMLDSLDE